MEVRAQSEKLWKGGCCLNLSAGQAAGLTLKTEPHAMRVPRCQRGGEVIEPMVSEQWFIRMDVSDCDKR